MDSEVVDLQIEQLEPTRDIEGEDQKIVRPNRKVRYTYVVSTIFTTYKKYSRVFELDPDDGWFKRFSIGLPYSVVTLFLGWWGFPFGIIHTPIAIFRNTIGGQDVTFKADEPVVKVEKFTNNQLKSD